MESSIKDGWKGMNLKYRIIILGTIAYAKRVSKGKKRG